MAPLEISSQLDRSEMDGAGMPLISIIIPCYNQAHFLCEAIESALGQSYANFEIVVVDDGSTDNSEEVARQYSGVRCIRQDRHGLAAARNTGLRHCRGEYLVFLDADDRLLPEAFKVGVEDLKMHPDCAFVAGHYRLIEANGGLRDMPPHRVAREHYAELLRRNYIAMHATVMYRRAVFASVGSFNTALKACEDYDLYLRIARQFPIHCHEQIVAEYRQHAANMTRNPALMLKSVLHVLQSQWKEVRRNEDDKNAYKIGRRAWQDYYGEQLVTTIRDQFKDHEWQQALRGIITLLCHYPRGVASLLFPQPFYTRRIQEILRSVLPSNAKIIVVGDNHRKLLKLHGFQVWELPFSENGDTPDPNPADTSDNEVIRRLENLRAQEGDFLLVPHTAFWWLQQYRELGMHLEVYYRRVWSDHRCIIYQLSERKPGQPLTGLQDLLVCPVCKGELHFSTHMIRCTSCKSEFRQFRNDCINLLPEHCLANEATRWSDRQQEMETWYQDLMANPQQAHECFVHDYAPFAPILATLSGKILDVGGGIGLVRHYLSPGTEYVVIDPSLSWLGTEWLSLADRFPCLRTQPSFVRGVGECLPFPAQTFDAVLACWSLNHASNPEEVFREVWHVLRSGGRFLIILEDMLTGKSALDQPFHLSEIAPEREHPGSAQTFTCCNDSDAPLQSDHIRIFESDIESWISGSFEVTQRSWIGQYLAFELTKLQSAQLGDETEPAHSRKNQDHALNHQAVYGNWNAPVLVMGMGQMAGDENSLERRTGSKDPSSATEYQYTFDCFSHNIPVWQKHLGSLAGRPGIRCLEVGSFEGRSAVWLLTNILIHETARIDCVGCFDRVWEWESKIVDMTEVEQRFDHNMRVAHAAHKVTKIKATSREALRKLPFESYDLVYLNGSQMAADVLEDAVLSFPLLKPGGILIVDDCQLARDRELTERPIAVDAFLQVYRGRYEILHRQSQIIIRKAIEGFVTGGVESVRTEVSTEVSEVALCDLDSDQLWGFNLEVPQPGSRSAGVTLDVIGWVLGRRCAATAVEIVAAGRVLQRVPLNVRRPDVAAYYPEAADGERSGFQTVVNVALAAKQELLVQAVLLGESRVPIAMIRLRAESADATVPGQDQGAYVPVGAVSCGSLRRVVPISSVFGFDRGVPIDRYYIENFLAREATSIHGRVLEIGDNSYTKKFGGSRVATSDVLHIADGNPQATIVGDLAAADHIPSDLFDCVILTQTLQCIYDVRAAIRTLYRILKPGGVVLATVPGITKISHRDWGYTWYWNFTALSARRLFEEAFPADAVNVETHGNVLAAISLLHGLATEELRRDELEHHDPEYEVLLTAKAVKPGLSNTQVREKNTRQRGVSPLDGLCGQRALILLYHRIAQLPSDPWSISVTPEHFSQHLEVLRSCSNPIPLQQLIQASADAELPARPVVVTFDDGYVDNLQQAKALLVRYEMPATFFLAAGYLGHEREFWWDELERLLLQPGRLPETLYLDIAGNTYRWELGTAATYSDDQAKRNCAWRAWEEAPSARHQIYRLLWDLLHPLAEGDRRKVLEELRVWARAERSGRLAHRPLSLQEACGLAEGELIEIGSHTMTHPALSTLSLSAQWDEIQQSKTHLETILKRPVCSFAYPFGRQCDYLPETVDVVREIGFTSACCNFAGVVDRFTDRFQLPRIQMQDWERNEFASQLEKWFAAR